MTAIGLALAAALLHWLAFFPVNAGWLGWVALTPLLLLGRLDVGRRMRYFAGWLGGFAFFLAATMWMRVADDMMYLSWIGLSLICSVYWPAGLALVRIVDRAGWPLCFAAAVVWPALEHLRSWLFGGFAWYFLAHTQHDWPAVIQIADIGGAYAVTMIVAAVNGLLADALTAGVPRRWGWAVFGLVAGALAHGHARLATATFTDGPVVALLQSNTPQSARNDGGDATARDLIAEFIALQDRAAVGRPDLIVWPETSFPVEHAMARAGLSLEDLGLWRGIVEASENDVGRAGQRLRTPNLIGLNCTEIGPNGRERRFNSALLVDADGRGVARYDKMHRVPFGEYVPCVEWLPFLKALTPYDGLDYSVEAGTRATRFVATTADGRTYRFGVLICYEDSDAPLAREYLRGPDPVDFLVNISNDGWFKGTQEHEQHLAVSRFRAVELRRSLARSVNMGISAVIDGNGMIRALPGRTWRESKAVSAVVTAPVPIDRRTSIYAMCGDWLAWLSWGGIAAVLWQGRRRRVR
jgi:apolipoprotein N-acyltransferase